MSSISVPRSTAGRLATQRARERVVAVQHAVLTRDVALMAMRVVLAWIFMYHGAGKLFDFKHQGGIAGTTAFFHLEAIPAPHLMAYLVGLTEFAGGLLVMIGLATPVAGLALAADMLVAMITTTLATGMLPKGLPGGIVADGFEINLALFGLAVAVALLGPGRLSLDSAIGLARRTTT